MPSILSISRQMFRNESGNALLKIETGTGGQTVFVCQFNPDECQLSTRGQFQQIKRRGKDVPIVQFMGGRSPVMNFKLFFDTSTSYEIKTGVSAKPQKKEAQDVSVYVKELMSLVCIEEKLNRPPSVTFCWGSFRFGGFVNHVDAKYTMFEKGGMPVQAEVSLELVSIDLSKAETVRADNKCADQIKCAVMTSDSSLWDMAEKEYGDASFWRDIAKENNIMNPLEIPTGTSLKVPAL